MLSFIAHYLVRRVNNFALLKRDIRKLFIEIAFLYNLQDETTQKTNKQDENNAMDWKPKTTRPTDFGPASLTATNFQA